METETFEFTREDDGSLPLKTAVFQALGAASVCWDGVPSGIFREDRAKEIGEALMAQIRAADKPNLGMATTHELLAEISVRMSITQNSIKGRELGALCNEAIEHLDKGVLDYSTWSSRH